LEKVECPDEHKERLRSWQIIVGSTAKKWSVHLVGEGVFDRNHTSLALFMYEFSRFVWQRCRDLLAEELEDGTVDTVPRQAALLCMCRFEMTFDSHGWTQLNNTFVDMSVYDVFRQFRVYGSNKMVLKGVMRPAFQLRDGPDADGHNARNFLVEHDPAHFANCGFAAFQKSLVTFLGPTTDAEAKMSPLRIKVH
jgi:hypothetical protein